LFKKHIYYIDAIEDPLKYKNDLLKWLHANPEFINKPDRTTGWTILHALQPDIMKVLIRGDKEKAYDEFLKLYIKGGQCDLMNYQSKTALSHWEKEGFHFPTRNTNSSIVTNERHPKRLKIWILLGLQPSGRDFNGASILETLANRIEKNEEQNPDQEIVSCLRILPEEDIFEFMAIILRKKINAEKVANLKSLSIRAKYQLVNLFTFVLDNYKISFWQKLIAFNGLRSSELIEDSPLHFGAESMDREHFEKLLELYPHIELRNQAGETPLHFAAKAGNSNIAELLLEKKGNPNARDRFQRTPLHDACFEGHSEVVNLLLSKEKIVPNARDEDQLTPLHFACFQGQLEVVKLLLSHENIDPNVRDEWETTPLHKACSKGHSEVVKLLLSREKIDPNSRDKDQQTPLHLASDYGYPDIVKLLLSHEKVDPNAIDHFQQTPLHDACFEGQPEVVKLLLSHDKIDPNARDPWEETPLHKACLKGHSEVVEFLLSNDKVDPNSSDEDQRTPLHFACEKGHSDIVKLLLSHEKIDPNAIDISRRTPLHNACLKGHSEVVKLLLSHEKTDPNVRDKDQETPLDVAYSLSQFEVCNLLLPKVDSNARDDFYESIPLHFAYILRQPEALKLRLENKKVDPSNERDKQGRTPKKPKLMKIVN